MEPALRKSTCRVGAGRGQRGGGRGGGEQREGKGEGEAEGRRERASGRAGGRASRRTQRHCKSMQDSKVQGSMWKRALQLKSYKKYTCIYIHYGGPRCREGEPPTPLLRVLTSHRHRDADYQSILRPFTSHQLRAEAA
jgi:hypothetical protein